VRAWLDEAPLFDVTDPAALQPGNIGLRHGAVALVVKEGRTATQTVRVTPVQRD
jgi:hypothetical protein